MQRLTLITRSALAISTLPCWSTTTHALEITAGDYEPLPAGMNALLVMHSMPKARTSTATVTRSRTIFGSRPMSA